MSAAGFRLLPLSIAAVITTGCASFSSTPALSDDPCADLQSIIADYPNRYADLRGSRSDFNTVTLYRAKKDIVKGHCEIWEWAGGDTAYVCSLNAPNNEIAEHRYEQTVEYVGGCLGDNWQPEIANRTRDGEAAGVVTRYRNPDAGDLVISVHNVSVSGTGRAARSNYVFIGTAGRSSQL